MLKLANHDSKSGEDVGTTPGMIVTSEDSSISPWEAPENQGFGKLRKFPREGKRPRQKRLWIYGICEEAGRCLVCWGKENLSLVVMNTTS
jgi:hypothetical protein